MKPENKKVLDDCRPYGNAIRSGQPWNGITYKQRLDIERAIAEEFQPGYAANRECEACIKAMIELAYYYYDTYEAGKH